jgi:NAD(P)H-nitrite reductase large subunit
MSETDDLKRDIIAGASLGPCKQEARKLLEQRFRGSSEKQSQQVEESYYKCLTNYAQVF